MINSLTDSNRRKLQQEVMQLRQAVILIVFVVLVTVGSILLFPLHTETVYIYYLNPISPTATANPAPSSISQSCADLRLSLEYLVKYKNYSIGSPFTDSNSYTEIALLLDCTSDAPLEAPVAVSITLSDDLGQNYLPTGIAEQKQISSNSWRYKLIFRPLNPQARSIIISAELDGIIIELTGAALP